MEPTDKRYSDEEVSAIIRRALTAGGGRDTIGHQELLDIARSSGISEASLEAAIQSDHLEGDLERAKEIYMKRLRKEFFNHLRAYVIVNGFLMFVNLFTGAGYLWVIWPMAGWGMGLLFHAADVFFADDEKVERGARKILRKKRQRMEMLEDGR